MMANRVCLRVLWIKHRSYFLRHSLCAVLRALTAPPLFMGKKRIAFGDAVDPAHVIVLDQKRPESHLDRRSLSPVADRWNDLWSSDECHFPTLLGSG